MHLPEVRRFSFARISRFAVEEQARFDLLVSRIKRLRH